MKAVIQSKPLFTEQDTLQIKKHHLSVEMVKTQIMRYKQGILPLHLVAPATIGNGIKTLEKEEARKLAKSFDTPAAGKKIVKFVPASGAATRMFRHLFMFKDENASSKNPDAETKATLEFINNLKNLPFYEDLKLRAAKKGQKLDVLIKKKEYRRIIDYLLTDKGLGYGQLPKALIKFHFSNGKPLTALEEHLIEAAMYAKDGAGVARIHFTVSREHRYGVETLCKAVVADYEKKYKVTCVISFSVQKPATDTIAVDASNLPFRNPDRTLLFRPSGHGALLTNLNDIVADVIYIKNIDNVQPDRLKDEVTLYKKALAGYLLEIKQKIHFFLGEFETGTVPEKLLDEAYDFAENILSIKVPASIQNDTATLIEYLYQKFDRPLRVCGMVKNRGDVGGGPFWIKEKEGTISLQIVEKSQVNTSSPEQLKILNSATHFNPVDIVCAMNDHNGEPYDLMHFRQPDTGFITMKSKDGKPLKTYELPGLWNGSMANWNTVFVEVPISTFSPVKSINDLLKKEHVN